MTREKLIAIISIIIGVFLMGFVTNATARAVESSNMENTDEESVQSPVIVEVSPMEFPQPLQIEILGQEPQAEDTEQEPDNQEIVVVETFPAHINPEPVVTAYSLPEHDRQEATGLELIIESLFGRYEPNLIKVTSQVPHTLRITTSQGIDEYQTVIINVQETITEVNKTWITGVLLFTLILYSFFRAIGGLVKRS